GQAETANVKWIGLHHIPFDPVTHAGIETEDGGRAYHPREPGSFIPTVIWLAETRASRIVGAVKRGVSHFVFGLIRPARERLHLIGEVVIDANAPFIGSAGRGSGRHVVVRQAGRGGLRVERDEVLGYVAQRRRRYLIFGDRSASEAGRRLCSREWVVEGLRDGREIARQFVGGRHSCRVGDRGGLPQSFVSEEEESLVAFLVKTGDVNRSAGNNPELVPPERCLRDVVGIVEEEIRIQLFVA